LSWLSGLPVAAWRVGTTEEARLRLWSFLKWRVRINRLQMFQGYVGCCALTVFALVVLTAVAFLVGGERFATSAPVFNFALLFVAPFMMALVANRAHDVGLIAWPPALFFGICFVTPFEMFGRPQLEFILVWPVVAFIPFILLAMIPGQERDNRFGAPARPGLWERS